MKQYVKPSFECVQLCPEETIACFGSPDRDGGPTHTHPPIDFGSIFNNWNDIWDLIFGHKKKKKKN